VDYNVPKTHVLKRLKVGTVRVRCVAERSQTSKQPDPREAQAPLIFLYPIGPG